MEDLNLKIQQHIQTSSSSFPVIHTPKDIAKIRMDEHSYPRYLAVNDKARVHWLAKEFNALAAIARMRAFHEQDAAQMAGVLDNMIMQDDSMADLTFPEIHEAFKNGVFGVYGEFYGISAPNLYGFLRDYLNSDKKKDATELVAKSKGKLYEEKRKVELALSTILIRLDAPKEIKDAVDLMEWKIEHDELVIYCRKVLYEWMEAPASPDEESNLKYVKPILWPAMQRLGVRKLIYKPY